MPWRHGRAPVRMAKYKLLAELCAEREKAGRYTLTLLPIFFYLILPTKISRFLLGQFGTSFSLPYPALLDLLSRTVFTGSQCFLRIDLKENLY